MMYARKFKVRFRDTGIETCSEHFGYITGAQKNST